MNYFKNVTSFYGHYCTGYLTKFLILVYFLILGHIVVLCLNVIDANNHRGISLVSCFRKLFTSVVNNRMIQWENSYSILTDVQFGLEVGCLQFMQFLLYKLLSNDHQIVRIDCTAALLILKRHLDFNRQNWTMEKNLFMGSVLE